MSNTLMRPESIMFMSKNENCLIFSNNFTLGSLAVKCAHACVSSCTTHEPRIPYRVLFFLSHKCSMLGRLNHMEFLHAIFHPCRGFQTISVSCVYGILGCMDNHPRRIGLMKHLPVRYSWSRISLTIQSPDVAL